MNKTYVYKQWRWFNSFAFDNYQANNSLFAETICDAPGIVLWTIYLVFLTCKRQAILLTKNKTKQIHDNVLIFNIKLKK